MIPSLTLQDTPPAVGRYSGDRAMSLDKAIFYGKEKRKPYRGAKAVSKACRNHGSCRWCKGNRTYRFRKNALKHCE